MKYESKIYAHGFAINVTTPGRAVDVMHNTITGGLLGGRSLDGVTVEHVDNKQYTKALSRSENDLRISIGITGAEISK